MPTLAPHRASDLLDPRDALGQPDVANGEGDTEAGARGVEEDPARWVVFVTPRFTTLALLPWQLRVGDHVVGAKGECEVVGGPRAAGAMERRPSSPLVHRPWSQSSTRVTR